MENHDAHNENMADSCDKNFIDLTLVTQIKPSSGNGKLNLIISFYRFNFRLIPINNNYL